MYIYLNFNRTISTDYMPWFITEYNGKMVVTEYGRGNIYFHQNETSYRKVETNCNHIVVSVLFDNYNHMLVLCLDDYIYIYNVDGTDTGLKLNVCNSQRNYFMNFDSKDRLVVICDYRIEIFY